MYKPPYWFFKNIKFPKIEIDHVIHTLNTIPSSPYEEDNSDGAFMVTSYFLEEKNRPDKIWSKQYSEIHEELFKQIGLYATCQYEFMYWSQFYRKGNKHTPHHHYNPKDDGSVILSWVHFIRSPYKGFRFVDKDGKYFVPPEQEDGDLICFPSYLWHEAIPNPKDKQRLVVAGNIKLIHLDTP